MGYEWERYSQLDAIWVCLKVGFTVLKWQFVGTRDDQRMEDSGYPNPEISIPPCLVAILAFQDGPYISTVASIARGCFPDSSEHEFSPVVPGIPGIHI
jgi:hypothetical protein